VEDDALEELSQLTAQFRKDRPLVEKDEVKGPEK
jgi:hypothetical protein